MDITKTIAIYGKSGHGKVLEDIARARGFTEVIWVDDDPEKEALSFMNFYEFYHEVPVLLGIGDNEKRQALFSSLKAKGFSLPSISHPSAVISPAAEISEGSVIMPNAVINADARIQRGCIINSSAVIEHECHLGEFVHISPAAALAGNVVIGALSHIGIGASIIQGIEVGEKCVLGAGSCLLQKLESGCTAAGVPAKVISG